MDDKSIKRNIIRFRKQSGLTQTDVADSLGMSRTAYRNFESGDTHIFNDKLEKVASLLDMSIEEILLGYSPDDVTDRRAEDVKGEYKSKGRDSESESETRIADLIDQNDTLKGYVDALKEIIRSKEEVIEMLRSYNIE